MCISRFYKRISGGKDPSESADVFVRCCLRFGIRTYVRGHNLFDIFYGKYKKEEKELLKKYIEIAPRKEFSDILDAADSFIYFQSKTKQKDK